MSNPNRNKPRTTNPAREAELIEKFLDNQGQELLVESERLKLRNKELDNDKFIASKTIEAQLKDREETRLQFVRLSKSGFIFVGVILFMLLVFGGYVIANDKEALLSEIIGLVIEFLKYAVGAVVGYFYAKSNKKSSNTDESN